MVQPFYVDTTGAWVLGLNQENGAGSQLQAGARAELIDSEITKSLSTFGGRIAAQTMQYMFRGDVRAMLNYAAFRPYAIMEAIRFALGDDKADKTVLNPAGGYSPVCYWLAKEFTNTRFIEMDVPKTINAKQNALAPFGIPENLVLHAVNLQETELHAIQTDRVDVMITLGAYVSHSDFRDMLLYIKHVLKRDAHVIALFPNKSGIENFLENSTVFSRIVNPPKGALEDENDLPPIFKDTGFKLTRVMKFSEMAKKYDKPTPADIEVIAIAQLGLDEETTPIEEEFTAETNGHASHESSDTVPPFINFDMNSFKRFPRRHRGIPPKSAI